MDGTKFDTGKAPLDLLPFDALVRVAHVLDLGAQKYGRFNYRKGMAWGRLLAACFRHLFAWATRENVDRESGQSHLAHAVCCLLFLLEYEIHGLGTDDRADA